MCGIAGFYSDNQSFSRPELSAMADSIRHRGPDAEGFFFDAGIGLAHRRLSIIDLSSHANQPMYSESGRSVMVYNGEIYNYDEIRREQGFVPRTTSDTEIALMMLEKWGAAPAAEQFNGMFAIAWLDKQTRVLSIVRDRVGIKPVYYYWDGRDFAFASELKALLQLQKVFRGRQVCQEAVNQFLHLGYIPAPNSIYLNIYKQPAGTILQFDGKQLEIKAFWQAKDALTRETITNEMQAKETLRDLVETSVRYRLKSDVPFGSFLSGGIDSSLVTAVAQRNHSQRMKTFSIGFDHPKHDESQFARKVAQYLGTEHNEFRVTLDEAKALVPSLLDVYDEPFSDTSAFPTMIVSQLARKHVTMVLSGDGGDELFMGYGAYSWAERLQTGWLAHAHNFVGTAAKMLGSRYKRVGNLLCYNRNCDLRSHIFSQEQYLFSQSQVEKMRGNSHGLEFANDMPTDLRTFTPAEQQAYFDLHYYLPDDLLVKVDRATMIHGLEARVPLLDYNIVEFALNVSPALKVKNGVQKHLLKQVLYDYIPANLFDRPKWGFSIPLKDWLKTDLAYLIDEYLSDELVHRHSAVPVKYVQQLKKQFRNGNNDYLYNRIWALIVLHKFLQEKM